MLEGINLSNYSTYSANYLASYEQPIAEGLQVHAQLECSYRSERDLVTITNSELEDALFKEPAYDLINLRVGLASLDFGWAVSAFVESLADEEYRTQAGGNGLSALIEVYGVPRIWGVQFDYEWE